MTAAPIVGITVDNKDNDRSSGLYEVRLGYSDRVVRAGGLPVLLPHVPERANEYADLCDGLLLTGGADPLVERFGDRTSEQARVMDERRMDFELALLECASNRADMPILAVCLGMQLLALHHNGKLEQSLEQSRGAAIAQRHIGDRRHPIEVHHRDSVLCHDMQPDAKLEVVSHHRQGIGDAGELRVVASSPDGIIEAIDDPTRPYYLGVQWHPERNDCPTSPSLNEDLIAGFVDACRKRGKTDRGKTDRGKKQ